MMKDKEELIKELKEIGIIGAIGDPISIQDTNYKILYQNQASIDFIGDHVDEYCYKAYKRRDHICEDCALVATFNDGKIHTMEQSTTTDKGIEYFEIITAPLRDSTGKIIAGIEVARNITERVQTEKTLRESEERFRGLIHAIFEGIIIYEGDNIREANLSFAKMFGYELTEVIGKSALEFVTSESYELIKNNIRRGYEKLYEIKGVKKNGTTFELEVIGKNWLYKGRSARVTAMRDITERKLLRQSEEKFRLSFENAKDAIFWGDTETGLIIKCNKAAEDLLEKKREEIIGHHQKALHPAKKSEYYIKMFKEHIACNGAIDDEAEVITKSGKIKPVHITSSVTSIGERQIIQGIFRDITERKKTEKMLQKVHDKLEERDKESTTELKETNTALKVLLKQLENDKKDFEENILSNIKHLILPYTAKLKKMSSMTKEITYLNVLESNLKEIISPFSQRLSSKYLSLTQQEIKVADLIKDGINNKDMAENLNISVETVKSHRRNIRKKLGIYSKRINLRTQLLSLIK